MIAHVVLINPGRIFSDADRMSFVASFERAVQDDSVGARRPCRTTSAP